MAQKDVQCCRLLEINYLKEENVLLQDQCNVQQSRLDALEKDVLELKAKVLFMCLHKKTKRKGKDKRKAKKRNKKAGYSI